MTNWIDLRKQLFDIMLNAFSIDDLERTLRYECNNIELASIAPTPSNKQTLIAHIIRAAERGEWVETLAIGLKSYNRTNQTVGSIMDTIVALVRENRAVFYATARQQSFGTNMTDSTEQPITVHSGGVAIGHNNIVVGERGVFVSGSVGGHVITGNTQRDGERHHE